MLGLLTNPQVIIEEGDFRVKKFDEKIYVGDDNIKVYKDGKLIDIIRVPALILKDC